MNAARHRGSGGPQGPGLGPLVGAMGWPSQYGGCDHGMQHLRVVSGGGRRALDVAPLSDAPEPPVPADCDLRDFAFMPLDVLRLRDSDLAAGDATAFRAAVLLWCAAWHQIPAGSLTNDDTILARLAGYGRDVRNWRRAKDLGALRGWYLASDGRLYHGVVGQKAAEAWRQKTGYRERTAAARAAKEAARKAEREARAAAESQKGVDFGASTASPLDLHSTSTRPPLDLHPPRETHQAPENAPNDPPVTGHKGQGEEQGQGEVQKSPSDSSAAPALAAAPSPPSYALNGRVPQDAVWEDGLPILQALTGRTENSCRRFLGKCAQAAGDNFIRLHAVLVEAFITRPMDPGAWIMGHLAAAPPAAKPGKLDWLRDHLPGGEGDHELHHAPTIDGTVA
jgi:hypothetical protein